MASTASTTTRRALLGALALAPVIAVTPALAEPAPVTAEESPLHGFALAWLKRFTEKGGLVHFDRHLGRVAAWVPEYHFSPQYERDKAIVQQIGLPARDFERNMEWRGAFYDGKIRELYDFAQSVPGGMDAIEAAVLRDHSLGAPVVPQEAA
jgi:hypothetical protein